MLSSFSFSVKVVRTLVVIMCYFIFQTGHLLLAIYIQKLQRSKCGVEEKATNGNFSFAFPLM